MAGLPLVAVSFFLGIAQPAPIPVIDEPLPVEAPARVRFVVVSLSPTTDAKPSTLSLKGHRHPGATYVYVLSGEVISRLGDEPEHRYSEGEAWSEKPGQAHYVTNASNTKDARLLVVFVAPWSATHLTEPIDDR